MKPSNVLVFKDFRVKVGDLGVSIRLENDKQYGLKGVTKGFVTDEVIEAFKKGAKLSREQLFQIDR